MAAVEQLEPKQVNVVVSPTPAQIAELASETPTPVTVKAVEPRCTLCRYDGRGVHKCRIEYRTPGVPTIVRIPRGARLTISALPHNKEIVSSVETFKEYTPNLDPGKYRYKLIKDVDPPVCSMIWQDYGEFLVDLTESQYRRLMTLRPTLAQGLMTTDGPRWVCQFLRCGNRATSVVQALQHEGEHFGKDLIHEADDPDFVENYLSVKEVALEHKRSIEAAKIGRPASPVDLEK